MGILQKIKNGAANKIAGLSKLSSDQLEKIDTLRAKYFSELPNPKDKNSEELTYKLLASASIEIYNSYLSQINSLYTPAKFDDESTPSINIIARCINITKWVTNKDEDSIIKLINVYGVLSNENCNIALIFDRKSAETNVYLAVVDNDPESNTTEKADAYVNRLNNALKGNFPGSEINDVKLNPDEIKNRNIRCFQDPKDLSVATVTNIPTEKSEKFISQTIEKLLDGIIPEDEKQEYTIIFLATPILDIQERKSKLADTYSALAPYSSWQTNYTLMDSNTQSSTASAGVNLGVSAGIQNGNNSSVAESESTANNKSKTDTENQGTTNSEGSSKGKQKLEAHTKGKNETKGSYNGSSDNLGGSVGGDLGPVKLSANYSHGWNRGTNKSEGTTTSDTITEGFTNTVSNSVAKTTGTAIAKTLGHTITKGVVNTVGKMASTTFGINAGVNFARSSTVSATIGKNEGITQSFTNYNIKHALEMLESQIKRYEQSSALGLWDFATYVISPDVNIVNNVAHSYLSLTQGENSFLSTSAVNIWDKDDDNDKNESKKICEYLKNLRHPEFILKEEALNEDPEYALYPSIITATTPLSGKELAHSLNFPQKSIAGLPVIQCAEFGRNISTYDLQKQSSNRINLGKIFHMHHQEELDVELDMQSLCSHTFITGSTGSGKSNTIYQILSKAKNNEVKFLVIEPAKGEYKNVFTSYNDVFVYGTNPNISPLLKINPFSFPKEIHILEHLDRLVEIFNVCWPMYAAMPAVLKEAIEKSYEDCGWDLTESINKYDDKLYPTFADVTRNIKTIIDSSEYDNENKGAYKGSLITRLKSLCNGINGLIFSTDELTCKDLFEKNVIVDLSRVGSNETKSLIMGMLVLKLQEYRMTSNEMNSQLKHLTVLEEAHNLLKRTSINTSNESSNLLGKSVEMLSNAIAEMRTFGEGFIIADQSPGLLDMSVIRNTNTKIIMRLPDQSDRELVGKAASLNDAQITELSKLPCGVASVYQNEWIEPVLCKIDKVTIDANPYFYNKAPVNISNEDNTAQIRLEIAEKLFGGTNISSENEIKDLLSKLKKIQIADSIKVQILEYMQNPPAEPKMLKLSPIVSGLFPQPNIAIKKSYSISQNEPKQWAKDVDKVILAYLKKEIDSQLLCDIRQCVITNYFFFELNQPQKLEKLF